MRNHLLALTAAGLALATAVTLGATSTPASADDPITYAVAGDSTSAYPDAWLQQMTDPGLSFVGGWQQAGYTTADVLAKIRPGTADVLVIALGTNDIRNGLTAAQMTSNMEAIVDKYAGARTVLITFTPPSDVTDYNGINRRGLGISYNRALVALAAKHGWMYADPWSFQRTYANGWGGSASPDGVHPSALVSKQAAGRMVIYIRQAAVAGNIGYTSQP